MTGIKSFSVNPGKVVSSKIHNLIYLILHFAVSHLRKEVGAHSVIYYCEQKSFFFFRLMYFADNSLFLQDRTPAEAVPQHLGPLSFCRQSRLHKLRAGAHY